MNSMAFSRRALNLLKHASSLLWTSSRKATMASWVGSRDMSAARRYAADLEASRVTLAASASVSFFFATDTEQEASSQSSVSANEARSLMSIPSSASAFRDPIITEMTDSFSSGPASDREDSSPTAPSRMPSTSFSSRYFLWKSRYLLNSAAMSGLRMYWDIRFTSTVRPSLSCSLSTIDRSSQARGVANSGPEGVFSITSRFCGLICR